MRVHTASKEPMWHWLVKNFSFWFLPQLLYDSEVKHSGSLLCKKANVENKPEFFLFWWGTSRALWALGVTITRHAQVWLIHPCREAMPCRKAAIPAWEEEWTKDPVKGTFCEGLPHSSASLWCGVSIFKVYVYALSHFIRLDITSPCNRKGHGHLGKLGCFL